MEQPYRPTLISIYTRLQSAKCPAHQIGYEDTLQQILYFEMLATINIPADATVLDIGCGRGDFYQYLQDHGYKGHYVGIDLIPHFIKQAKKRFPQAEFVLGDFVETDLEPCDYAFASAIFDYHAFNLEQCKHVIKRMFALARRGIAWNGLADMPPGRKDLWTQPLPIVLELCQSLSPYYSIRCDYDPLHFTAFIYKREHFYSAQSHKLVGHLYQNPDYSQQLETNPHSCAAQFGLSLQQLNMIASLWA